MNKVLLVTREHTPSCEVELLIDPETGAMRPHCEMSGFWALREPELNFCLLHVCHMHLTMAINSMVEVK